MEDETTENIDTPFGTRVVAMIVTAVIMLPILAFFVFAFTSCIEVSGMDGAKTRGYNDGYSHGIAIEAQKCADYCKAFDDTYGEPSLFLQLFIDNKNLNYWQYYYCDHYIDGYEKKCAEENLKIYD